MGLSDIRAIFPRSLTLKDALPGVGAILTLLAGIAGLFLGLLHAPVNPDAGYTLPTAAALAQGLLPFRDILLSHTTASLWIAAFIEKVFGPQASYTAQLAPVIFAELCILVLVARIAKQLTASPLAALWSAAVCACTMVLAEGIYHEYEPFMVLCGLGGIALVQQDRPHFGRLFIAGCLFGLAIIFKQYGVVFIPVGLLFFLKREMLSRAVLGICSGAAVVCLLYYLFLWQISGLSAPELLNVLSLRAYEWRSDRFLPFLGSVLLLQPWILLLPFLVWRSALPLWLSGAIVLTLLPGIVRPYPHYLLIVAPFASIAFGLLLSCSQVLWQQFLAAAALITSCIPAAGLALQLASQRPRAEQFAMAAAIQAKVPMEAQCMVIGDKSLTYLLHCKSPDLRHVGFNFLEVLSSSVIVDAIGKSDIILIDECIQRQWLEARLAAENVLLPDLISKNFDCQGVEYYQATKICVRRVTAQTSTP